MMLLNANSRPGQSKRVIHIRYTLQFIYFESGIKPSKQVRVITFIFVSFALISTYFINVGYLEGKFSATILGTNNVSKIRLSTNRNEYQCIVSNIW